MELRGTIVKLEMEWGKKLMTVQGNTPYFYVKCPCDVGFSLGDEVVVTVVPVVALKADASPEQVTA